MKKSTNNNNKINDIDTKGWINAGDFEMDLYFIKLVQNAKTLRQVRKIFIIKEIGIIVNHDMILEDWREKVSKGNKRLANRLRRENINLEYQIKNSPIFNSNSF